MASGTDEEVFLTLDDDGEVETPKVAKKTKPKVVNKKPSESKKPLTPEILEGEILDLSLIHI